QLYRFNRRLKNPLKKWKYSPVDEKGQELWDDFTRYKNQMFSRTHNAFSPWVMVKSNNKKQARLEAIRYVLSLFNYTGKENSKVNLNPDPNVVQRYFRMAKQIDL
ncbi:MAG TPA: polyphosphate kinase 2, partial [Kaistella chaponensis]|nr:polyphosphate kinase 2 [Kaistella chaponensis]